MTQFHRFCYACLLIVAACALAGCGPRKEVVSIPVPTACAKAADVPPEPPSVAAKLTGDARQDVAVLAVSALELRDYAGKLRALLAGCTG